MNTTTIDRILSTLSASDREGLARNVRNWMRALGIQEQRQPEPVCVITGCALIRNGLWTAVDLFDIGEFWLVNATDSNDVRWFNEKIIAAGHSKQITILNGCPFWERRGVFLIHKSCAFLNQAAIDHIK